MHRFKRILVGIDLSEGDKLIGDQLTPANEAAVKKAFWLAKVNSAQIVFLSALDLSPKAEALLTESDAANLRKRASERLNSLVVQARDKGIPAEPKVTFGSSWIKLIQEVIRESHDMVIVGTRGHGSLENLLFGSTAIKLIRKCPCVVWVINPHTEHEGRSILVAHDLKPVGEVALQIGCGLAALQNRPLHIVHSADHPFLDSLLPADVLQKEKAEDCRLAEVEIAKQLSDCHLDGAGEIHVVSEPPEVAILKRIKEYDVGLVVLGTLGRTGISGLIMGNTAERLMPRIRCSVIAVKPEGFQSPVKLA